MKRRNRHLPKYDITGLPYNGEDIGPEKVFGFGGGGGSNTNTVQKADPWGPAQPYLQDIMSGAQGYYNQGPVYYPNLNPIAPLSSQTQQGLNMMQQPGAYDPYIQQAMQYGLGVASDPRMQQQYNQFVNNLQGTTAQDNLQTGINMADANVNNYLVPTAKVNAAPALTGILNGAQDPRMKEFMAQNAKLSADQIIQNNLLPQQMDQLISGGYGGSSSQNIGRQAATDITNAISRNNNALILDQQAKQLQAAGIVTGAQQGASQLDQGTYNLGLNTGNYLNQGDLARQGLALQGMIAGDQTALSQAQLGGQLNPLYNNLQFAPADRQLQVGSVYDQRNQAARDAEIAKYFFNAQAPYQGLVNYANLVNPIAGQGGVQSTQTSGGGPSGFAGAVGGATAGLGILGATGGLAAGGWAAPAATMGAGGMGPPALAAGMGPVGWGVLGASAILGSGLLG